MSLTTPITATESHETFKDKAIRRFKEEPLVPIGTLATCYALTMAMIRMRSGQPKSFNRWLRVRIIAQGLTVAAVVAGSYAFGRTQQQLEAKARADQERILENAAKERREFEERLRGAEEAHEREVKGGWWRKGESKTEMVERTDKGVGVREVGKEGGGSSGSSWWGLVGYGWVWGSPKDEKGETKSS
ncbi:hypothetical protein NEOLEDRAFT_1109021 [Neolentinus lepideus HHB14362 ss-1]|uniref:HIG1 domain-containing protein n=1 Tax=Neolentinus lepideus HHB14362 ss-1 TaxID=1314782 RepID=A0A165UIF3_9AGAM|nr:hypothetical protein NEOLEDRAFT_1109021 [Neolentinus lepideus HHB14362 ss-1]